MLRLPYRALCALLMLVLVTPAPAPAAPGSNQTAPAPIADDLRGMVVRDPWYDCNPAQPGGLREPNRAAQDRMGQVLRQAGVRWVRIEFFVSDKPGGLEETFRCYDYFMQEVAPANNLQVLGLLGFGLVRDRDPLDPSTGLISTTLSIDPIYGGGVNTYMRDWLGRALAIGERYGGTTGHGSLSGIEVLNEQNRLPANGDAVPAEIAARLHTKLYRLFNEQRGPFLPRIPIIIGGLHPRGSGPKPGLAETDVAYLREYFGFPALGGAARTSAPFQEYKTRYGSYPVDGLGYHPYPAEIVIRPGLAALEAEVGRIEARMGEIRIALGEIGADTLPLWITEIGYDAGRPQQSQDGQAAFMRAVFRLLGARRDVHTIFWFKYEDFPGSSNAPNRWGIVRINFTASPSCEGGACYEPSGEPAEWRPSYLAYRELAGGTIEYQFLPAVKR